MQIGDIVYYNKGNKNLEVGKGVISKVIKDDGNVRVVINDYKENGVICNGVIGTTFFSTEKELRHYFGMNKRKSHNLDLIHKSTLVNYLNNKFPNIITDDIRNYIFELPDYDTEIYGEWYNTKENIKICSVCGQKQTEVLEFAKFCPNCGANLFRKEIDKMMSELNKVCRKCEKIKNIEINDEEIFDDIIAEGYDGDNEFFWDNL